MRMHKILIIIALLAFANASYAEEQLGLKEALSLALKKNLLVKASSYESAAGAAGVKSSRSRYLPRVIFEERAVLTNSGTRAFMMKLDQGRFSMAGDLNHPDPTGDFQTAFTVEQPLFDMNLMRGMDVAGLELSLSDHALEKRRQEIAFQVYAAYLNVQKSRVQLSVAEQAVRDATEHRRIAGVRSESGVGLKYDELRIATFLAELEQQRITAENEVKLARLRLGQVVGLPSGAAPDIAEHVTALELTVSQEYLEQEALTGRPDIKESAAEVAKGDAVVAVVKGSNWPTLYASGSYQMNDRDLPGGRDNDSWVAGAVLRWDISEPLKNRGEIERARAKRNAAESYKQALRQEASIQIREALLRRSESEKRLAVSRNAIKDAEEMVRLVSKRFENDLSTAVELLDAQTALNRVRAQLAENEAGFALATATVYQRAGLFMKEVVR
jgi:outer membrane protein TolC